MPDLRLPWPPSVNRYWRHPSGGSLAGRHLISQEGRKYRKAVLTLVGVHHGSKMVTTPVSVVVNAFPPDRRRRDLDNILKSLLDALVHAGVIADDSLIDDLRIIRRPPSPLGAVLVSIATIEAPQQ